MCDGDLELVEQEQEWTGPKITYMCPSSMPHICYMRQTIHHSIHCMECHADKNK